MKQTVKWDVQERVDNILSKYPWKDNQERIKKALMGEWSTNKKIYTKEELDSMEKLDADPGDHLDNFVPKLIRLHRETRKPIKTKFNNVILVADKGVTAADLIEQYNKKMKTDSIIYRASPEYKRQTKLDAFEVKELQKKCDEYIKELDTLDFTNYETILDWFCKYQVPSDRVGVDNHKNIVLKTFHNHWFKNNENTGKDFNENDEENFARYLIWQALSTLERASVHHMIIDFTEKWKKKFNK